MATGLLERKLGFQNQYYTSEKLVFFRILLIGEWLSKYKLRTYY